MKLANTSPGRAWAPNLGMDRGRTGRKLLCECRSEPRSILEFDSSADVRFAFMRASESVRTLSFELGKKSNSHTSN